VLEHQEPGAKVGIIAFGSSHWAVVESLDQLRAEQGMAADYLRLRAYPFSAAVEEFIAAHERVYVVEQNRDGQMQQLIKMDIAPAEVVKLRGVCHYSGHPLDSRFVTDNIVAQENAAQENGGSPTSARRGQIWATKEVLQEQK
jgi:2-oxoglutarate ferredoxin oxidoreductase subunit alpha